MTKNKTLSQVWLAATDGSTLPRAVTSGDHDSSPAWSPDGRSLAFASKRGAKTGETHAARAADRVPGRDAHDRDDEGRRRRDLVEPGRSLDRIHQPHPDERYDAEDESWQAPRKVERFFSKLDNEGWIFDRPKHVYVVAADGTGAPRNLTPGEFQHSSIEWKPDSSGLVFSSQRHDTWDLDFANALYSVTLDGTIEALTGINGQATSLRRCRPTARPSPSSASDDSTTYPQNVHVAVVPSRGWRTSLAQSRARSHLRDDLGWRIRAMARRLDPARRPPRIVVRRTCTVSRSTHRRRRESRRDRSLSTPSTLPEEPSPTPPPPSIRSATSSSSTSGETAAADLVRRQLPVGGRAQVVGEVHRAVHRRQRRDRRMDHAARELRRIVELPGAAQRARRAAHPVRRDVLRRVAGASGGRLRRHHEQPARRLGPRAVVGPGDPRPAAPRRARAPAGAASMSTMCSPCSTPRSTATRSATATASA